MTALSSLGTALTVIFAFSVAALFAELLYVLYRRRLFRIQTASAEIGENDGPLSAPPTSKELLYFFCWKHHQSRVEPKSSSSSVAATPTRGVEAWNPDAPPEILEIMKLQGMVYGPSRMLFTIKEEEEREASEGEKKENKASLKELLREAVESPEDVSLTIETEAEVGEMEMEITPFSTPCASPLYYTPSASPSRESDSERMESFVVLEVDGE